MNIGFDLDKVFVNHPPFIPTWLIQKLYGEKANGHLSYRMPGRGEIYIRKISHVPLLRPAIKQNIQELEKIHKKKGVHTFLISSRYSFLKNESMKIMQLYHLNSLFDDISFNFTDKQPHVFKNALLKEKNVDRFVDDDLPLLRFLAEKNPKILFYWLNDTRQGKITKNIFAVTNLSHITD